MNKLGKLNIIVSINLLIPWIFLINFIILVILNILNILIKIINKEKFSLFFDSFYMIKSKLISTTDDTTTKKSNLFQALWKYELIPNLIKLYPKQKVLLKLQMKKWL